MADLWRCDSPANWAEHFDAVSQRTQALNNEKLTDLERWFFEELPVAFVGRSPPYMTAAELVQLMDWKLTRGKWRPRLLDFVKAHSADIVQQTTQEAFDHLSRADMKAAASQAQVKQAIETLNKLKGIGPATASAVLTAYDATVPFMSDEAMAAALSGSKEYTLKQYLLLVEALQQKAQKLSVTDEGRGWTAKTVERCLWSAAAQHMKPKAAAKSKTGAKAEAAASPTKPKAATKRKR
ncbi:hypothetical protein WJX72_007087 [[Myrmecia] bisecta]|uniref:Uncharacterized protein n=1 Tax=[Myrmecia] bisecta TaxID=41462 RepID=A0AAW1PUP1_9CHLO